MNLPAYAILADLPDELVAELDLLHDTDCVCAECEDQRRDDWQEAWEGHCDYERLTR